MRAAAPHLPRWFLSETWSATTLQTALDLGAAGVAPHYRHIDADLMATARQHGLVVVAWTVNDEAAIRRFLDLGVDAIATDFPARVERLRRGG
jgi:glycerophosphoryl diester phosphodiesterase